MQKSVVLFLFAIFVIALSPLRAQSTTDPGDIFVNAYMAVQAGERAEQQKNYKEAMTKLQYAAKLLDQIADKYPKWQPPIVEYRKKRTSEAIARVQESIAKYGGGKGGGGNDNNEPALPRQDDNTLIFPPGEEIIPPKPNPGPTPTPKSRKDDGPVNDDPIGEVQKRMKRLQDELSEKTIQLDESRKEKERLAKELSEAIKTREASEKKQNVLQTRADNAEKALMDAVGKGEKETDNVKGLRAELEKVRKEMRDLRIESEAETEYREQLADRVKAAQGKITSLAGERDNAQKENASVPSRIAEIQKELDKARKEKSDFEARLAKTESSLTNVTKQRDDALQQLDRYKEAKKAIDELTAKNTELMTQLSTAEQSIKKFQAEGAEKDKQITALKQQVTDAKKELADAKKQSSDYQQKMADLQTRLDESNKQLTQMKADNATGVAERKKLQDENLILRGIVLRQQKEQARRDQTKKLVLAELAKLEIKSTELLSRIDYLGQPVVKLTEKELKLFRKPEIQISDNEISIAAPPAEPPVPVPSPSEEPKLPEKTPDLVVKNDVPEQPKLSELPKATPEPVKATPPPQTPAATPVPQATPEPKKQVATPEPKKSISLEKTPDVPPTNLSFPPSIDLNSKPDKSPDKQKSKQQEMPAPELPSKLPDEKLADTPATGNDSGGNLPSGAGSPNLPADLVPLARDAKDQFERGNYRDAEKTYERILARAPDNLYVLSNLGVVRFRAGKLKLAEEVLKKATQKAPEDGFAHCTLGIVYYSEQKYDEAVNELTRALAINPKNATAHNYLGITASQKGWQEAALKELETAVNLDPTYADAHFNLAVVYATQQPPNKEMARKFYKRAIELGAEPDSSLEQLIK